MVEYLIREETLTELADAVRSKIGRQDDVIGLVSARDTFDPGTLPEGLTGIPSYAFANCKNVSSVVLPESLKDINTYAFSKMENLTSVTFRSKPATLSTLAFYECTDITINVPWSEGEKDGAPWGATNATINYRYNGGATK